MEEIRTIEPAWETTRNLKTGRIAWAATEQNIDCLHEVPSYAIYMENQ